MLINNFQYLKQKFSLTNFKNNIWILFSAFVFFVSNSADINKKALPFTIGIIVIFVSAFFIDKKTFRINTEKTDKFTLLLSIVSSVSVSLFYAKKFHTEYLSGGNIISFLCEKCNVDFEAALKVISVLVFLLLIPLTLVLLYKIYSVINVVLKKILLNNTGILIISVIFFLLLSVIAVYSFTKSNYYNENAPGFDIIYTSDSPYFLKTNVWMDIYNAENDLRQPLFGLFSIPLVAPFYILGIILQIIGIRNGAVIAVVVSQVLILFLSLLLVSDLIANKKSKTGFFLIMSCSYMTLLFSIMPEQYVCAVFWIFYLLNINCDNKKESELGIIASTGSLLTSGLFAFAVWDRNKSFKDNFAFLFNTAFCWVLCFFSIGQSIQFINFGKKIDKYKDFAGGKLTLIDKLFQYSNFPINCILKPNAEISIVDKHFSWQLIQQNSLNWIGLAVILFCIISFILNRKNKTAKICFGWILFSFCLLFGLGWGTEENGLILYSLYFGWAFVFLLHLLVEKIFTFIKAEKLILPFEVVISIILLCVNITGIKDIITFTAEYYPAV